jgi:lysophospholipase L1-like esterase
LKRWWARAALLGIGALIGLAVSEIFARVYFRHLTEDFVVRSEDLYYYNDAHGVRHHVPGKVGFEKSWDGVGRVAVRINSHGLRGPEISLPKSAGVRRLLILGDSVTLSGHTREEDTFVSLLQEKLLRDGATGVEVLNAGVGNVGLREEKDFLESLLSLDPSVVVLVWYLNDARPPLGFPEENVYANPIIRFVNRSECLHRSVLVRLLYEKTKNWLIRKGIEGSRSLQSGYEWVTAFNEGRWRSSPSEFRRMVQLARFDWGDAWNESHLNWSAREILELNQRLRKRKMRFGVVLAPVWPQVAIRTSDPFLQFPQRTLAAVCQRAGIPVLDLAEALRPRASADMFFDQCHFTPTGNRAVAECLARFLKEARMVSDGSETGGERFQ